MLEVFDFGTNSLGMVVEMKSSFKKKVDNFCIPLVIVYSANVLYQSTQFEYSVGEILIPRSEMVHKGSIVR